MPGLSLSIQDGLATISGSHAALDECMAGIPGCRRDETDGCWRLQLGPDRAEAIGRLTEHLGVRVEHGAQDVLNRLRSRRNDVYPTIEAVEHHEGWALSLCDDWRHTWAAELGALSGVIARPGIGRISVPLTADIASEVIEIVRWRGARLSPRAARRLAEADPRAGQSQPFPLPPQELSRGVSAQADPSRHLLEQTLFDLVGPRAEHGQSEGGWAAARERRRALHAAAQELVDMSCAVDSELRVPGLGDDLLPFQRAGVAYALRQRRCFIADEQGLGKTVQALATVHAAHAYPALVICPASLKLNWEREGRRWLPNKKILVLGGRATDSEGDADVLITNYDVVHALLPRLRAFGLRALIADESHYCKNPAARRTRATIELSSGLPVDALRLALTGTPVVNRPEELVPQLRLIGRFEDIMSAGGFSRRIGGKLGARAARERLHRNLRATCYVRRTKSEVLPQLPDKRRLTVAVPLTNEAEYQRLEDDLIAWLRELKLDAETLAERIDGAQRARALVKLTALRRAAAEGKLAAAVEWIGDFLASEEKLIVFAHHRHIQQALCDAFPAAAVVRGTDPPAERDRQVRRFQSDREIGLCICSLEVASHGFTLTAAADVAFLELGWTPSKHDQAEDRAHRIGQTRAVTAWYLLAADTIDERIAALIDGKRSLLGSITDGTAADESSLIELLLGGLLDDTETERVDQDAA